MKSNIYKYFLVMVVVMNCSCVYASWLPRSSVEFQQRGGLPNFLNQVNRSKPVKVGFLGGSITAASGWRPMIIEWMKDHYNNENIIDYNAGVGGTNSMFGVHRLDKHLLNYDDFDLIFVEFTVNDNSGEGSWIEKSMEGIVRKIWNSNSNTDICFIYTVQSSNLEYYTKGLLNISSSKHDSIASYYDIPSISFGVKIDSLIQYDSVVFSGTIDDATTSKNSDGYYVFTYDGVHPTSFGHQIYSDIIQRSFQTISSDGYVPHLIKERLFNSFENTKMLVNQIDSSSQMKVINTMNDVNYLNEFLIKNKPILVSTSKSSYYQYTFKGNVFGLNFVMGPSTGRITVEIDNVKHDFLAFDSQCTYWRENSAFFELSDSIHIVKIYPSLTDLDTLDKKTILSKTILDSSFYKNELIINNIMINGDLTNKESISLFPNNDTLGNLFWVDDLGEPETYKVYRSRLLSVTILDNTSDQVQKSDGWLTQSGISRHIGDNYYRCNLTEGESVRYNLSTLDSVRSSIFVRGMRTGWGKNIETPIVINSNKIKNDTCYINQRYGASDWISLGEYNLDTNSYLDILASKDGLALADAIYVTNFSNWELIGETNSKYFDDTSRTMTDLYTYRVTSTLDGKDYVTSNSVTSSYSDYYTTTKEIDRGSHFFYGPNPFVDTIYCKFSDDVKSVNLIGVKNVNGALYDKIELENSIKFFNIHSNYRIFYLEYQIGEKKYKERLIRTKK